MALTLAQMGSGGDLGDGAGLGEPPIFEDGDAIGEGECVDRVVGDEDGRAGEVEEVAAEVASDFDAGTGAERGQRLIEEKSSGVGGERAGESDAPTGDRFGDRVG